MKRTLLIALCGFVILSLACSMFSQAPAQLAAPTEPVQQVKAPTALPEATKPDEPTIIESEPTAEAPTAVPVPTQAEPTGPVTYSETFDKANPNWSDPVILTSQAVGHDPFVKLTVANGVMRFAIQDKETYTYSFYKPQLAGDTEIKVNYEPRGMLTNGIAIVCRVNPERTTWYEVRMIPAESQYNIYKYNKQDKESGGNPYELLARGILPVKEFSPARENIFSFTCSDTSLKLDVNEGKRVITVPVEDPLKGSTGGLGVMSYNEVPVVIDFKTVTLQAQ